jgi:DNA-binding FadR family transcriptional regulator
MPDKLGRSTLGETILERLETRIRNGEFPAGARLPPERELAASFGVARGPVREALRALALAALVDIRPGRGTFVCKALPIAEPQTSLAQVLAHQSAGLRQVYHARRLIETELLLLATRQLGVEDFRVLHRLMDRMRDIEASGGDRQAFAYTHYAFDTVIAEAAGNRVLVHIFRQLRDWELTAHQQVLRLPGAMHNSIVQHQQLLAALTSGNKEAVARAAQEHFASAEHFIALIGAKD